MNDKDRDSEEALHKFVDAFIESLNEEYRNPLEPFDRYAEKVRFQIYRDIHQFRSRFINGYRVIMEELAKEKQKPLD